VEQMLTPSGRFHPDKKICFSMSDFHPGSVSSAAYLLGNLLNLLCTVESCMECGDNVSGIF
jgi:ubiquitin-conjugating enzyme E2 J2